MALPCSRGNMPPYQLLEGVHDVAFRPSSMDFPVACSLPLWETQHCLDSSSVQSSRSRSYVATWAEQPKEFGKHHVWCLKRAGKVGTALIGNPDSPSTFHHYAQAAVKPSSVNIPSCFCFQQIRRHIIAQAPDGIWSGELESLGVKLRGVMVDHGRCCKKEILQGMVPEALPCWGFSAHQLPEAQMNYRPTPG